MSRRLLAIGALEMIRRKIGVRRDYESIYSLGVAFTAYAAAEAVHGSGFLAAFAAGLDADVFGTIPAPLRSQTESRMTTLLAFVPE